MWSPVVEELRALGWHRRVVAIDQRAHGDSDRPAAPFDWWDLGRDTAVVAEAIGARMGVGHSSGAAALIMAELLTPGRFETLVLIEPIVFPGPYEPQPDLPMVAGARKRRSVFPDRASARENFRTKDVFARWDERALEAYVRHAFRSEPDGYTLKCHPDDEAEFYLAGNTHGAWERMSDLDVPVTLVAGAESDTHGGALLDAQAARLRDVDVVRIDGHGHLVPMEAPAAVARVIVGATSGSHNEHH